MRKYFFSLFSVLAAGISALSAQSPEDINSMRGLMKTENIFPDHRFEPKEKSVDGIVFYSMFYLYKRYISSQDGSHCMFTPSCSEYGWQAVRKKGMLMGMVDGFDRLSRCNGLSRELYHKHPTTNRFYDPVE